MRKETVLTILTLGLVLFTVSSVNVVAPIELTPNEVINYTGTTRTVQTGDFYSLTLGQVYIQDTLDDGKWKNVYEAKSLKGDPRFYLYVLDYDPNLMIDVKEYNATSITVEFESKIVGDVPITFWKPNATKELEFVKEVDDGKTEYLEINDRYKITYDIVETDIKTFVLTKPQTKTYDFGFGQILEFGEHSTTIELKAHPGEIVFDLRQYDANFDYSPTLKAIIDIIPGAALIESAQHCFYIAAMVGAFPDVNVDIWRLDNQTFTASIITPEANLLTNDTHSIQTWNSTTLHTYTCFNSTDIIKADYDDGNDNSSIRFGSPAYPTDIISASGDIEYNVIGHFGTPYTSLESSDNKGGTGKLPVIQINYSLPDATFTITNPTNVTYNSTTTRLSGTITSNANIIYNINLGGNYTTCNNCAAFTNLTSTDVVEGVNNITFYGDMISGNKGPIAIVNFSVDTTPPTVALEDPNTTYRLNSSFPFNFNASDTGIGIDQCWFNVNGTNFTLGGCANATIGPNNVTSAGLWTAVLFVNDTVGNEGTASSSFYYYPWIEIHANSTIDGSTIDSFNLYIVEEGNTYTTTNGTMNISLLDFGNGTKTLRMNGTGYGTEDFSVEFVNTTRSNTTYRLTPASVWLKVMDETQAALGAEVNITFNLTLTNATTSSSWTNQGVFFRQINETPTGIVTFDISSYGYYPRQLERTVSNTITNNITAYLLTIGDGALIRFHVIEATSAVPLPDSSVDASRFIGSAWVIMAEGTTDDAGISTLPLAPLASYRITAAASGYTTQIRAITPSASDYYFYMAGAGNVTYHTPFENISYWVTPTSPIIQTNVSYEMMFNITSSDGSLEWFSMNLTNNVTTYVYSANSSVAAGGNLSYYLNTTDLAGNWTLTMRFKHNDWPEFTRTYYYRIINVNATVGSLDSWLISLRDSEESSIFKHLVVIIASFMAAGVASKSNMRGGGVISLIVLIVFTAYGWFSWELMLLTALTIGAVYALKEGI